MSKNNIAQQYNSMVASIEDAKIYDGRENITYMNVINAIIIR